SEGVATEPFRASPRVSSREWTPIRGMSTRTGREAVRTGPAGLGVGSGRVLLAPGCGGPGFRCALNPRTAAPVAIRPTAAPVRRRPPRGRVDGSEAATGLHAPAC